MKITAVTEINTELYSEHKDAIKSELRLNVCNELLKHDAFFDAPVKCINGNTEVGVYFFAISPGDIHKLRELSDQYPEMKEILRNIIIG